MRKFVSVALVGMTFAGAAAVAVPAFADPATGTYRPLAGVGSDTIDGVMDAISNAVTIGGVKQIANYNALGSATIQTQADASCSISRPNGSGAGRAALDAALTAGKNCLQFARSSSGVASTTNAMSWVSLAVDGVTFAVRSDGAVPKSLTSVQIVNIFKCGVSSIHPVLPQTGSGTRSFWLGKMGITEGDITAGTYPCLTGAGTTLSPAYTEEHNGVTLATDQIMPFSIAQWNAQSTGTITDVRGKTVLGNVDSKTANVLNTGGVYTRTVYNVIPKASKGVSPWSDVFVGSSSLVCQQSLIIQKYGFAVAPDCGTATDNQ
jgi:hypothetical protein